MKIFEVFGEILLKDRSSKVLGQIGKSVKDLVKNFTKVGAATVAAFSGYALKAATDFESELANVATLLDGDVNKRIGEFGKELKELSKIANVPTKLLTDGLYQTVSAFGDSADSMKILETAAKGARAGNAAVTDSVNLLSAVMKGYNDVSAESAQKVSDLSFLTVKLGQHGSVAWKQAA